MKERSGSSNSSSIDEDLTFQDFTIRVLPEVKTNYQTPPISPFSPVPPRLFEETSGMADIFRRGSKSFRKRFSISGPTKPPSPRVYWTEENYLKDMRKERNWKELIKRGFNKVIPLKGTKNGLKKFAELFEQPKEPENPTVLPKSVTPTARLSIVHGTKNAVNLRRESRRLSEAGTLSPISRPSAHVRKRSKQARGGVGTGEARKRKRKRIGSGPSNIGDGVGIKVRKQRAKEERARRSSARTALKAGFEDQAVVVKERRSSLSRFRFNSESETTETMVRISGATHENHNDRIDAAALLSSGVSSNDVIANNTLEALGIEFTSPQLPDVMEGLEPETATSRNTLGRSLPKDLQPSHFLQNSDASQASETVAADHRYSLSSTISLNDIAGWLWADQSVTPSEPVPSAFIPLPDNHIEDQQTTTETTDSEASSDLSEEEASDTETSISDSSTEASLEPGQPNPASTLESSKSNNSQTCTISNLNHAQNTLLHWHSIVYYNLHQHWLANEEEMRGCVNDLLEVLACITIGFVLCLVLALLDLFPVVCVVLFGWTCA